MHVCALLVLLFFTVVSVAAQDKMIMCYFGSWATYRHGNGEFDVEDIDPFICTHLMFGFAGLDPNTDRIRALDPYNELCGDWEKCAYGRFTALKQQNPNLKTILAIGGWNEGSTAYSHMATTPERRRVFIDSCVDMVLQHDFDGLDLDWEYPGGRKDSPGLPEDKVNFAYLIREMRTEFDKHGLMITAAVSAGQGTIDQAYDIPAMAETMDIISLMTYDYHGWFENHSFTGHNSPLYGMPEENDPYHPGYNFNTDWAVQYWISKGARKDQLLLGMGSYGRGFELQSSAQTGFYAPAVNGMPAGRYTGTVGFWGYNEYCEKMFTDGEIDMWTLIRDVNCVAPFVHNGRYWFGFDDKYSIRVKSQYVLDQGLAGAMVWSIDTDDHHGFCGDGPFPLTHTINEVLNGGPQTAPPGWTTPSPGVTTTRRPGNTVPPTDMCDGTPGHKPDPSDCHQWYTCTDNGNGGWTIIYGRCEGELVFDPSSQTCIWADDAGDLCNGNSGNPTTRPVTATTANGSPTTTRNPNQVPNCDDGEEGYHNFGDCSNFYWQCHNVNGEWEITEGYCGPGTVFNIEHDICDWPMNTPACNVVRGRARVRHWRTKD